MRSFSTHYVLRFMHYLLRRGVYYLSYLAALGIVVGAEGAVREAADHVAISGGLDELVELVGGGHVAEVWAAARVALNARRTDHHLCDLSTLYLVPRLEQPVVEACYYTAGEN